MPNIWTTHVAPFVGVWIEMLTLNSLQIRSMSLPSWECGLKSYLQADGYFMDAVAPFVGVWIEIDNLALWQV